MKSLGRTIQTYSKSLWNKLYKFYLTGPDKFEDKPRQDLELQRNRLFLAIQVAVFLLYTIELFKRKLSITDNLGCCIIVTFATLFLIVLSYFYSKDFRLACSLLLILYSLTLTYWGIEGLQVAWLGVQTSPILIYLLTGSFRQLLLICSLQALCLNLFYSKWMENSLMDMAPDIFAQTFTYTSNLAMGINITFITLYHHYREMIKEETVESEKREEFHKQKTFLLGFSHELKSLLNSVMGNLKLISLEHLSHKGRDLLLNVEVCSELLSHLVNNILDTGKVDINDLEINPSPHNIYDTLEKIWRVSSELIKRKGLEGRFRVQNNIPKGLGLDHARLTQIILNLIDNAVKFTEKGLIDISIEWINNKEVVDKTCFEPVPFNEENDQDEGLFEKRQRLSILDSNTLFLNFSRKNFNQKMLENNSDTSKGILKATITDTGRGISKEDIEKIFEKFSQISPSDSKEKLGTGLGLFITKELCLKMNGQVKGFSKEEKGSSFILCLPAEPTPEINSHLFKLESIKNIVEKKQFKALVVDDVPFNQLMMKEFLNRIGVEVIETAENGLDACNKFSDFAKKDVSLNIITLDLDMPVMSGKLAAQKIREIEAENNMSPCLLIIVSGNCSESEISECLDPNNKIKANAFLKKPVSINELGRIVAEHRPSDNYKHFRKYNTM